MIPQPISATGASRICACAWATRATARPRTCPRRRQAGARRRRPRAERREYLIRGPCRGAARRLRAMDAEIFDKRGYPLAAAAAGYGEWADSYEDTVAAGLDQPL